MEEYYTRFRRFQTIEEAIELKDLFAMNGIESIIADNLPPVDITFSLSTVNDQIEIRLKQSDFKKAEEVLEQSAKELIDQIDQDYYLFEFSNEELYEVLLKSDEWNSVDFSLAQKILKQRGKSVDKELLNSLKNERLKDLAKPEKNQKPWIIAGYIFSILGGFLGLIIGYVLWTSNKALPNGEKVYSYSLNDRMHGKYIFWLGLISIPITLFLRMYGQG